MIGSTIPYILELKMNLMKKQIEKAINEGVNIHIHTILFPLKNKLSIS